MFSSGYFPEFEPHLVPSAILLTHIIAFAAVCVCVCTKRKYALKGVQTVGWAYKIK